MFEADVDDERSAAGPARTGRTSVFIRPCPVILQSMPLVLQLVQLQWLPLLLECGNPLPQCFVLSEEAGAGASGDVGTQQASGPVTGNRTGGVYFCKQTVWVSQERTSSCWNLLNLLQATQAAGWLLASCARGLGPVSWTPTANPTAPSWPVRAAAEKGGAWMSPWQLWLFWCTHITAVSRHPCSTTAPLQHTTCIASAPCGASSHSVLADVGS